MQYTVYTVYYSIRWYTLVYIWRVKFLGNKCVCGGVPVDSEDNTVSVVEAMSSGLSCGVCSNSYDAQGRIPKSLPCGHALW
jgi:hypothetical protein